MYTIIQGNVLVSIVYCPISYTCILHVYIQGNVTQKSCVLSYKLHFYTRSIICPKVLIVSIVVISCPISYTCIIYYIKVLPINY